MKIKVFHGTVMLSSLVRKKKGGRSRLNPGKSFDINNDEDKTVEYASSNWNTRGGTFGCEFVYCEGWSAIFETTL